MLTIIFTDAPVAESDEDKPGIFLDSDASGNLVCFALCMLPGRTEYQVTPFLVLEGKLRRGKMLMKTMSGRPAL